MAYKIGSTGTEVKEIQGILKKLGYYSGPLDGIYGTGTANAVRLLQRRYNLNEDGIIGDKTYSVIERLLSGYDYYTVRPGDTISKIASKYRTNIYSIITANSNIDPYTLQAGQQLIIPYSYPIVQTDIDYTYNILKRNILSLKTLYPFITIGSIGKSVLGRELYFIKLGQGKSNVFYNGAHHSLEWITSPLLMKFAENFLRAYTLKQFILDYDVSEIWRNSTIYIIPMVNPDGVELVLNGLSPTNPYYNALIRWNNSSKDFSKTWSANNRGVDLNHNYNASWQEAKNLEQSQGVFGPGPTRYGGLYPESEPETKAIVKFTRDNNFRLVLAYHSQGEVIYWNYDNINPADARKIGETLSRVSGYTLETPSGITAYGGYKDWFIKEFQRPGYTIEVGYGTNPLPISQFPKIYRDNIELLLLAAII
ncbi:MAG: M14 family metallopeptidase [Clostridiaceae bacterium]